MFPGLAFDDWDLDYYTQMFVEKVQRNPTSVECFDLAQSNRYSLNVCHPLILVLLNRNWIQSSYLLKAYSHVKRTGLPHDFTSI